MLQRTAPAMNMMNANLIATDQIPPSVQEKWELEIVFVVSEI